MSDRWDKPLKVGEKDVYTVTVSTDKWLENETLTAATATLPDGLTAMLTPTEAVTRAGNVISIPLTGVAEGYVEVRVDYATATRTDNITVLLKVV